MDGFSKDGRKLRPRRHIAPSSQAGHEEGHRPYGEHHSYSEHREHRPYGEHRSFGEHKSYGEHKPYGEKREGSFGRDGERRPYGEHHSFGEHKSYGEGRPSGEKRQYGERRGGKPGFSKGPRQGFSKGPKPGFGKAPRQGFNKESDAGINRMIENSPRKPHYSGVDVSDSPVQEVIRLNRFIANSGVCSRREADTMIQAGVVTVNGEVVTELGTKVNVFTDVVKFNGETLKGEDKVYIVMNKPKGFVTTASDPHADKTVMDLIKGCSTRVYPVGRLDKATTGVLMFTNDGEISERLTHPAYDKKKIYQVILNRPLTDEDRDSILSGVELSDGPMAADALEFIDPDDHRKLGIEIHSGKNRVVRRLFEAIGYEVRTLDRVYFAGLTKKGLKKGEWRYLTESEVNILKMGAYV